MNRRLPMTQPPMTPRGTHPVYTSARATLRATPQVTKKPNPGAKMLSTVPAEHMAAFLNELKTVRLRKVGSTSSANSSLSVGTKRKVEFTELRCMSKQRRTHPILN